MTNAVRDCLTIKSLLSLPFFLVPPTDHIDIYAYDEVSIKLNSAGLRRDLRDHMVRTLMRMVFFHEDE